MKKVKGCEIDDRRFKAEIWSKFCSNDYPFGLPTAVFLTTILTKAKKTYRRYVSFYCWINWQELEKLEQRLLLSEKQLSQLYFLIYAVAERYKTTISKVHLTQQYQQFLLLVEEFSFGVVDDRILANDMCVEKIFEEIAA